ncbi:hypothetical protein [Arthrobacter sp. 35W]|uniref:hypothetical protein n=1 Tax=Arthrobacter sp. 35W TaxID=1132441 RepID=UPI000423A346|nr:hypothetical protein [Arthrobacter sp. 35W]
MRSSHRAARIAKFAVLPAALLVSALAVSQASYSAFSATTNNAGNSWESGTLALANNASGTALFTATAIKPGDTGSKCITVSTSATVPSTLKLYAAAGYSAGANSLGDHINVTVSSGTLPGTTTTPGDCTGFTGSVVVPSTNTLTTFAAAKTSYATGADSFALPAGGTRTYKIDWTFTSTGSPATDNPLQGNTASIGFTWESQS